MPAVPSLTTSRLILRPWKPEDRPAFAALNADPHVMEHFPHALDRAQSDAMAATLQEKLERNGFGLWALEASGVADFIGFVGLSIPTFQAHFTPCIEVCWRLAHPYWGHGYATEAAAAALEFAFRELKQDEIVSFTVPANLRSRRVMGRLGMTHNPEDDFDHPQLPAAHPLCRHVLYRLLRPT